MKSIELVALLRDSPLAIEAEWAGGLPAEMLLEYWHHVVDQDLELDRDHEQVMLRSAALRDAIDHLATKGVTRSGDIDDVSLVAMRLGIMAWRALTNQVDQTMMTDPERSRLAAAIRPVHDLHAEHLGILTKVTTRVEDVPGTAGKQEGPRDAGQVRSNMDRVVLDALSHHGPQQFAELQRLCGDDLARLEQRRRDLGGRTSTLDPEIDTMRVLDRTLQRLKRAGRVSLERRLWRVCEDKEPR